MSSYIGKTLKSNNYGDFEVLDHDRGKFCIRFLDTGFISYVSLKEMLNGQVKDWIKPHVCGVGYRGKGTYKATLKNDKGKKVNSSSYEVWRGTLRRCYDKNTPYYFRYGGKGVTVSEVWFNYQNFAKWYEDSKPSGFEGKLALDKDLTVLGNTIYSPENCRLIPYPVNSLFAGGLKKGIYFKKDVGKFRAQLHRGGVSQEYLGDFTTEDEALKVYTEAKQQYVMEVAEKFKEVLSSDIYENLVSGRALNHYLTTNNNQ